MITIDLGEQKEFDASWKAIGNWDRAGNTNNVFQSIFDFYKELWKCCKFILL